MTAFLQDLSKQVDSEYADILQLSQNMMPTGLIGQIYDEYLTQSMQYDRFKSYTDFLNSLNIATFGLEDILLSAYYNVQEGNGQGGFFFQARVIL